MGKGRVMGKGREREKGREMGRERVVVGWGQAIPVVALLLAWVLSHFGRLVLHHHLRVHNTDTAATHSISTQEWVGISAPKGAPHTCLAARVTGMYAAADNISKRSGHNHKAREVDCRGAGHLHAGMQVQQAGNHPFSD
jgi:hypothetical protein